MQLPAITDTDTPATLASTTPSKLPKAYLMNTVALQHRSFDASLATVGPPKIPQFQLTSSIRLRLRSSAAVAWTSWPAKSLPIGLTTSSRSRPMYQKESKRESLYETSSTTTRTSKAINFKHKFDQIVKNKSFAVPSSCRRRYVS